MTNALVQYEVALLPLLGGMKIMNYDTPTSLSDVLTHSLATGVRPTAPGPFVCAAQPTTGCFHHVRRLWQLYGFLI